MGCMIEKGHNGDDLEVHAFDSKEAATRYVTTGRGYTFDRHEPWGFTPGLDFYQGPEPKQRACVRLHKDYWRVIFWESKQ